MYFIGLILNLILGIYLISKYTDEVDNTLGFYIVLFSFTSWFGIIVYFIVFFTIYNTKEELWKQLNQLLQ